MSADVPIQSLVSAEINELAAALAKAQGVMNNAAMNKTNPHFKSRYADMGSVLDAVRPPLSANGLSIVQQIRIVEAGLILRTILMHSSGQFLSSEYPLPATTSQQAMGSALTYARRYCIAALVCNASDEDDDANTAPEVAPPLRPAASLGERAEDSRARFLKLCEAKIKELDDPRPWLNDEPQLRARRDFLTSDDVAKLKTMVTEKLEKQKSGE